MGHTPVLTEPHGARYGESPGVGSESPARWVQSRQVSQWLRIGLGENSRKPQQIWGEPMWTRDSSASGDKQTAEAALGGLCAELRSGQVPWPLCDPFEDFEAGL